MERNGSVVVSTYACPHSLLDIKTRLDIQCNCHDLLTGNEMPTKFTILKKVILTLIPRS